jgi:hypothetical protein
VFVSELDNSPEAALYTALPGTPESARVRRNCRRNTFRYNDLTLPDAAP